MNVMELQKQLTILQNLKVQTHLKRLRTSLPL
jgi:hypothetical protein